VVQSALIVMNVRILILFVCVLALLAPAELSAADLPPRSILYFNQSDLRGPFYYQIFSALRSEVSADSGAHLTLYVEDLDLSRFKGEAYQSGLREFLKDKYRDKPIGVIVAVGGAALERVLKWRTELWPDVPVVFAMVEKSDFDRRKPPPDVTGSIVRLRLADAIKTAHAVVPHLKSVVLVVVDRPRAQSAARRDPDQSCPSSVRPRRSSSPPAMEMSRTQCGPSRRAPKIF
jgi:hypothetical protein